MTNDTQHEHPGRAPVQLPVASSLFAPAALLRWASARLTGGPFTDCRLWRSGMNDTYLLHAGEQRSLLRVYRAGWRSDDDVGYELDLLRWLARAGIPVALPLSARDGATIHHFVAPEGVRPAVHFAFAPGTIPPLTGDTARRLGTALADLHRATAGFRSPFPRFRLNLETLLWRPLATATEALSDRPADRAFLTDLAADLARQLDAVAPELESGPLHGDVYQGNVHGTPDGALTWFDFDLCGEGWYAYDLAVFRMNVRVGERIAVWPDFLGAYEERRTLPRVDREALPLLVAVRDVWHLGHFLANMRSGRETWWLDGAYLDRRLQAMREWAAGAFVE
jgi:Ser/Thr protein kinase RdoA (MazF antagonist)